MCGPTHGASALSYAHPFEFEILSGGFAKRVIDLHIDMDYYGKKSKLSS
jgi:hypothetical protein